MGSGTGKTAARGQKGQKSRSGGAKAVDAGKLDAGGAIDEAALGAAGLFTRRRDGVRLLGSGALSAKLTLKVTGASKTAVAAVEKAGGSVTVTGAKDTPSPEPKSAESANVAQSDNSAKAKKSAKTEKGAKSENKESETGGSEEPSK
jgi:large subunit ribosomal protein L15